MVSPAFRYKLVELIVLITSYIHFVWLSATSIDPAGLPTLHVIGSFEQHSSYSPIIYLTVTVTHSWNSLNFMNTYIDFISQTLIIIHKLSLKVKPEPIRSLVEVNTTVVSLERSSLRPPTIMSALRSSLHVVSSAPDDKQV